MHPILFFTYLYYICIKYIYIFYSAVIKHIKYNIPSHKEKSLALYWFIVFNAIDPRNLQFQLIFDPIRYFRSRSTILAIENLIIGDIGLSEIFQTTIVSGESYFLPRVLTSPSNPNRWSASGSFLRSLSSPASRAMAISFNETSNRSYGTPGWSSLRPLLKVFSLFVPNYRQRFLWFSLSWVWERRSLGSCWNNFCGMELQLAARVSVYALKPNKGIRAPRTLRSIQGEMTVCVFHIT